MVNDSIEWNQDLEIGIPFVDSDHRTLVKLLNQIQTCVSDNEEALTLGSVFNALDDYVGLHFQREEKLQELTGFPDFQAHKKEHDEFLSRLHGVRDRFKADPERVSMADVARLLGDWFANHIATQDVALRDHCGGDNDSARQAAAQTLAGTGTGGVDWELLRVLVVDDNPNFVNLLETVLGVMGVKAIHRAESAREGLARLSHVNIDVVLVDWIMDDKDGLDFVRELRRGGVTAKMLMVTGFAQSDYATKASNAGANGFIEKPITARGLIEAVTRTMLG